MLRTIIDMYGSEKRYVETKSKTRAVEKVASPFLLSLSITDGRKQKIYTYYHNDIPKWMFHRVLELLHLQVRLPKI